MNTSGAMSGKEKASFKKLLLLGKKGSLATALPTKHHSFCEFRGHNEMGTGDAIGQVDSTNPTCAPTTTAQSSLPDAACTRRCVIILFLLFGFFARSNAQDVDLNGNLVAAGKGFRILGAAADDNSGYSVSPAGDVNGDGIDDIIIGALSADPFGIIDAGISYVIFGRYDAGGAAAFEDIQLSAGATAMPGNVGFRILGAAAGDKSGISVSAAGDVNGDGASDVIVGASDADPQSGTNAGISYVIFGRNLSTVGVSQFSDIHLTSGATAMSTSVGFRILGAFGGDLCGYDVSAAGDVNGDGIDDVIIGAPDADPSGHNSAGISYVIFGRDLPGGDTPFGDIQLISTVLVATVGFRILGAANNDYCGFALSAAGDVNGDGVGDIIVGLQGGDPAGGSNAGISYVIFGRNLSAAGATPFGDIQLTTGTTALSPAIGFRILGAAAEDQSGYSVSSAGDVNGDGFSDIIIGALLADPSSGINAGISYVIFGRNISGGAIAVGDIQLTTGVTALSPSVGFRILGAAAGDQSGNSVSGAGDLNGDGISDVIVGAPFAESVNKVDAGISYEIFGRDIPGGASAFGDFQLTTGTNFMPSNIGYRILGAVAGDYSGFPVCFAGDINGDGVSDVVVGARLADPPSGLQAGITYVIFGVDLRPTSQPSSQPSQQPSRQPSAQPSAQPTGRPLGQPSLRPTSQPTAQPSGLPSAQPSSIPSCQPSTPPTLQPSTQPSSQPSMQPSSQPSRQPNTQPFAQPSGQPSTQPSGQLSSQPSTQPSTQSNVQPSTQPSAQPSTQRSTQPSIQPSVQPSMQPSTQPSVQPSAQPTALPSAQPMLLPSAQPRGSPSMQPSSQPFSSPTAQPSTQPLGQPSTQPSSQPSNRPSAQPSGRPSGQPSGQPSNKPSAQPTARPSQQPSVQPSTQPSSKPSCQPSLQPSRQPTIQPSSQPSAPPSRRPSVQPSVQPSRRPSGQPSSQPSSRPSAQPTSQPSIRPSAQSSEVPSILPTSHPSSQPTGRPSNQFSSLPSSQPSSQPTGRPTNKKLTGEWSGVIGNISDMTSSLASINNIIWACGVSDSDTEELYCSVLDKVSGKQVTRYPFPWMEIASITSGRDPERVALSGSAVHLGAMTAEVAMCDIAAAQVACSAMSFEDTMITAGSYAPAVDKTVYIGTYNDQALVMIVDQQATTHSYLYSTATVRSFSISHIQSPPNFVGSFVVGTCVNSGLLNCICTGMVRTDSGVMTAMYVTPMSANIVNNAELVNAMALEYANPDSFIAGGLQLSGDADIHAYLLCVNSIYQKVIFGVRYLRQGSVSGSRRRSLQSQSLGGRASVVKGMVLVDSFLYLIVAYQEWQAIESMAVLKTDMATGSILQQVQIYSFSDAASIECTDFVTTGLSLVIACTVQYDAVNITQALVLSVNRDLAFSMLPAGFRRYENITFVEEPVAFKRTFLPMSVSSLQRNPVEYTFNTADGQSSRPPSVAPTLLPTSRPSSAPSGQPSSSPTAAPSVSPQPTSQPSTGGPTNTYNPTVKPTLQPSRVPSIRPTVSPTSPPTILPTARPSTKPSTVPSTQPSTASTVRPTPTPTAKPTRKPSACPSAVTTRGPTTAATPVLVAAAVGKATNKADDVVMILLYILGGLAGLWASYQLLKCCVQADHSYKRKRKLQAELDSIHRSTGAAQSSPTHHPDTVQNMHIGAYATSPTHGNNGAYATSTPIVPNTIGSSSSSSVLVSSLHSSELSDISYSVYSDAQYSEAYQSPSEHTKSGENVMEEGGGAGYEESDSGTGYDNSTHSAPSDGHSDCVITDVNNSTVDNVNEGSERSINDSASVMSSNNELSVLNSSNEGGNLSNGSEDDNSSNGNNSSVYRS